MEARSLRSVTAGSSWKIAPVLLFPRASTCKRCVRNRSGVVLLVHLAGGLERRGFTIKDWECDARRGYKWSPKIRGADVRGNGRRVVCRRALPAQLQR